ncbi:MAG: DUF5682 family protein [Planctomycetota bacterium]
MAADERLRVFGIRHHGPGSAASLRGALEAMQPQCVLIEGPPEADALIPLAAAPGMRPPLAILTYPNAQPERARFFPLAEFSPEWCAMQWAHSHGATARFIDLPTAKPVDPDPPQAADATAPDEAPADATPSPHRDPLGELARAAGHSDGEAWWNALVEQSTHPPDVFAAIAAAMRALREQGTEDDPREARREAFMRQKIRTALAEHDGIVAVVCGAWHTPALTAPVTAAADRATLRGFKRATKVEACWVPWTEPRLARASGYGAGVRAPGWYAHLWRVFAAATESQPVDAVASWQTRVADALREAGHAAATSSVIDATRLAVSLAAVRAHPVPGLAEMQDASLAALCHGESALLRVVEDRLVIGTRVGEVDDGVPQPPLQADLQRLQRKLRLVPDSDPKEVSLDLRTGAGMAKSELFWRLQLLDVPWATLVDAAAGRGTFREVWLLQWQPELSVGLAEALVWGPTIAQASHHAAASKAGEHTDPAALANLVRACLFANLAPTAEIAIRALQELAVRVDHQLVGLMRTVPALVDILRYGTARELPLAALRQLVDRVVVEVGTGLVYACIGLDDEQATATQAVIRDFDIAVARLESAVQIQQWRQGLSPLIEDRGVAPRLRGLAARIAYDRDFASIDATAIALSRALSPAVATADAGAWLEGFLSTSGEVLLHDASLLACVDAWIVAQDESEFIASLPMLRRAFSSFDAALRRRLLNAIKAEPAAPQAGRLVATEDPVADAAFERALPLLRQILGLAPPGGTP